jgi:hypothetical protein
MEIRGFSLAIAVGSGVILFRATRRRLRRWGRGAAKTVAFRMASGRDDWELGRQTRASKHVRAAPGVPGH